MRENISSDILDVKIKQKELVNKSDIDKRLININKITSNKTKHIEPEEELTNLTKKLHKHQKRIQCFVW